MLENNDLIIRTIRPDELDQVLGVYKGCEDFLSLGPVAKASIAMVKADLELSQKEGGDFCGIFDRINGEMIGIVDFVRNGWLGDPSTAFLSLLMIALPHRSRGIGEQVVKLVEADILSSGEVNRIASGVQVNNPGGIRFWQRMGYQIVSGPENMEDGTITYQLLKMVRE